MLKPDRNINAYGTEINCVFNGTGDAGLFLIYGTAGSGSAIPDDKAGTVTVGGANASGAYPAGLLMHPFVTFNALLHRNWYKVTQYPGDKATLLRDGWVTTNVIASGAAPDAGKPAHLGPNGTVTDVTTGPKIGEFMSRLDEQGYCRLMVKIPR